MALSLSATHKKIVGNTVLLALIGAGLLWVCLKFIDLGSSTFTDNAQIRQNIVSVNSKVQGFVSDIRFDEYTYVRKGDTLLTIEDAEFVLQVAQAEANYRNAMVAKSAMETTIKTSENNIAVSDAALEEVKVNLSNAEKNYKRYQNLLAGESVTRQDFDMIETQYKTLKAKYETLLRQRESAVLYKSEQMERLQQNEAGIALAQAAVELARLNLSYTVLVAPCNGYTSRKEIQEGELVQPGRSLLSIVSDEEYWVIANYREKQMHAVSEGSMVDVTVDALHGKKYHGKVSAISKATGSQYSIVPQDNATGNFIKVEQRIPVKIVFTTDNTPEDLALLRSGMNVECKLR